MNYLHNKFLLGCLSAFSLTTSALSADVEDNLKEIPPITEEHVPVRSRDLDPEKREVINRQRAIDSEREDAENAHSGLYRRASLNVDQHSAQFRIAPSTTERPQFQLTASYPTSCHWLTSISDTGRTIEMEDGSHWEVTSSDQYVLNYWRRSDSLVISPNYNWFTSGDYYITNKSNNTYVKANLYIGPMAFGQYSHWIVAIDHVSGHFTLENGVTWCTYGKDSYVFREWEVNDHIVLGTYDNWVHSYDHILINVNMDTHVRARQY